MVNDSPASILYDGYGDPIGVIQDGIIRRLQVEVIGRVNIVSSTTNRSSVISTESTATLLSANMNRLGAIIFNNSTSILYIALGADATKDNFTDIIPGALSYMVPFGYNGVVTGIWESTDGYARMTEVT